MLTYAIVLLLYWNQSSACRVPTAFIAPAAPRTTRTFSAHCHTACAPALRFHVADATRTYARCLPRTVGVSMEPKNVCRTCSDAPFYVAFRLPLPAAAVYWIPIPAWEGRTLRRRSWLHCALRGIFGLPANRAPARSNRALPRSFTPSLLPPFPPLTMGILPCLRLPHCLPTPIPCHSTHRAPARRRCSSWRLATFLRALARRSTTGGWMLTFSMFSLVSRRSSIRDAAAHLLWFFTARLAARALRLHPRPNLPTNSLTLPAAGERAVL